MRSKLITVLVLGAALGAAPALGDGRGHKHGHRQHDYHYREPVRVVRYERYVEVPPPRVYYSSYSPRPVYVHYDEPRRHRGDHDHDLIKWIGGAIVLGEIIHHTGGH